jgi:hypothetical protein
LLSGPHFVLPSALYAYYRIPGENAGARFHHADHEKEFLVSTSLGKVYEDMEAWREDGGLSAETTPCKGTINDMVTEARDPGDESKTVTEKRKRGWQLDFGDVGTNDVTSDSKTWVSRDFKADYEDRMAYYKPIVGDAVKLANYIALIDVDCELYDRLVAADDMKEERESASQPANMAIGLVKAELKLRQIPLPKVPNANGLGTKTAGVALVRERLAKARDEKEGEAYVISAAAGAGPAADGMALDGQEVDGEEENDFVDDFVDMVDMGDDDAE